jgi:hypothetical protein
VTSKPVFDGGDEAARYEFTTRVRVVPGVLAHGFDEFRNAPKWEG